MADPSAASPAATESTTGASTGGATGQGTTITLAAALSALASASSAVSDSVNQLKVLMTSVSEDIKKVSRSTTTSDDVDVNVVGNDDAFIGLRDERQAHARINALAELSLANAIEIAKRCGHLHLDHSSALPPLAPRSSTGPGTAAS